MDNFLSKCSTTGTQKSPIRYFWLKTRLGSLCHCGSPNFPDFLDFPVDTILRNWKEVAFSSRAVFGAIHRWVPPPQMAWNLISMVLPIVIRGWLVWEVLFRMMWVLLFYPFRDLRELVRPMKLNCWLLGLAFEKVIFYISNS